MVFRAVVIADKQPCAKADTVGKQQYQCHQGIAGADCRKGLLAYIPSDNHTVDRIVGQLKQISRNQRHRKADQGRQDRAFCHIVRHMSSIILAF